ncbi:MAG: ROK family protein [Pirellulaceae bacterium]
MAHNNTSPLVIGIDVGGTKIETALVDESGQVVHSERQPTESERGPDAVIQQIVATVQKLLDRTSCELVSTLGIGIAGQIDKSKGVLVASPNLEWRHVPLKGPLEEALGMNVFVTNDVDAAAFGEWQFGAGRGVRDLFCVFVGTGVGAGVISGGRMLTESKSPAWELGHVPLVFAGRACSCRHRGCLEAYAGGWAIAERAQEQAQQDLRAAEALLSLAGSIDKISAQHVSEAFHRNDPLAKRLVEETGNYLAAAVVGMVNTFNPSLLVLGGGVIEGLPQLVEKVEETVRNHAFSAFVEDFRVRRAELGGDAGVIGGAAWARAESTNNQ